MKHTIIYFSMLLLLGSSCGSDEPKENSITEPTIQESVKTEAPVAPPSKSGMAVYQNMEIVEYCVLIPDEYEENTEASEKAGHVFIHSVKENNELEVKGLLRANTEVSVEEYMAGSLEDAALEGKVIQKKELSNEKSVFYIKGYWNNTIQESRFIEVCWLRRDDVVKYYVSFDIADTTLWNERLKEMLAFGSSCK